MHLFIILLLDFRPIYLEGTTLPIAANSHSMVPQVASNICIIFWRVQLWISGKYWKSIRGTSSMTSIEGNILAQKHVTSKYDKLCSSCHLVVMKVFSVDNFLISETFFWSKVQKLSFYRQLKSSILNNVNLDTYLILKQKVLMKKLLLYLQFVSKNRKTHNQILS